MNLYDKFKNYNYGRRFRKRYKKFKNCSLPYPFWDKKRDTFEYVYFEKGRNCFETHFELFEVLGDITHAGLTYDFKANFFSMNKNELCNKSTESHSHDFNGVVRVLYEYPESFKIPDDCLEEYSEQQLRYLKRVQHYLLLIGLKDFTMSEERICLLKKSDELYNKKKKTKSIIDRINYHKCERLLKKIGEREELARCKNSKAFKYADCWDMHINSKEVLNKMLNEKISYRIFMHCYSKIGEKYFLLDNEENYYGVIEFVEEEKIKFKDIKEDMIEFVK